MTRGEQSIFERLFPARTARTAVTLILAVTGPVLLVLTYLVFRTNAEDPTAWATRAIVYADLVYVIAVSVFVVGMTGRLIRARRIGTAGSRLHLRLGGMFAALALLPTALVAIFAGIFFNFVVEGWFSDRVQAVVGSSLSAAQAYENEQRNDLITDARLLAGYVNNLKRRTVFVQDDQVRGALAQGQQLVQRGLKEAFIIDGAGDLKLRGENSYLFYFERPSPEQMTEAQSGRVIVIQDWDQNEFRAIFQLSEFVDRYLYIAREVDGNLLNLLDETKETAVFYRGIEENSGRLLLDLGLVYLFFAIVVTFSAILIGLRFAERLAQPFGALASAAQRVGDGDLDTEVPSENSIDEFAILAQSFNQMTSRVKRQRDDLLRVNAETEEQRSMFDNVLSSVTAGVIGLTPDGVVEVVNDAAAALLSLDKSEHIGRELLVAVPEFSSVFRDILDHPEEGALAEVKLSRSGKAEVLLVKMTARLFADGTVHGYVVTFDDVTDLVSAQRMAAWGDVARRLAHEIKNPLTPIQLSAERLQRKFAPIAGEHEQSLEQYTNVIIRQAGDLRRIVDEFSKFARMPEPNAEPVDFKEIVDEVVLLQKNALKDVRLGFVSTVKTPMVMADRGLLTQAVMNVVKNAGEALLGNSQTLDLQHEVRIKLGQSGGSYVLAIEDNGPGFPKENRSRLIEPYVTNREGGSGLGLSIVKKIIEQHGGTLELLDATVFEPIGENGARVRIRLPKVRERKASTEDKALEDV